jgi:hypothetical protein
MLMVGLEVVSTMRLSVGKGLRVAGTLLLR